MPPGNRRTSSPPPGALFRLPPALVLLAASLAKLADPAAFQLAVYDYRLAGFGVSGLVAGLLPAAELVTAAALLLGRPRLGAALAATLLYTFFISVLTTALLRGTAGQCGCFGFLSLPPAAALAIDLLLLACAAAALLSEIRLARSPSKPAPGTA